MVCGIRYSQKCSSLSKRPLSADTGMIISTMRGLETCKRVLSGILKSGDLIPGAGGIRKLRWKDSRRSKGKRGGLRIIYYCFLSDEEIWLLTLYDKDDAADLTKGEKDQLRRALEVERAARKSGDKK